jgi:cytochrome c-type biogenesis protein CcmH
VIRAAVALVLLLAGVTSAQQSARHVKDEVAYEIGSQLRCVVCQNLSVADSPSEMAGQMRALIRERLAAGDSPEQVTQYFVDRYSQWVLLAPRAEGFNLVVWAAPIVAVVVGLVVVALLIRRWTRRPAPGATAATTTGAGAPGVDPAMRERIRREMETDEA